MSARKIEEKVTHGVLFTEPNGTTTTERHPFYRDEAYVRALVKTYAENEKAYAKAKNLEANTVELIRFTESVEVIK